MDHASNLPVNNERASTDHLITLQQAGLRGVLKCLALQKLSQIRYVLNIFTLSSQRRWYNASEAAIIPPKTPTHQFDDLPP
jgi:hypothetical protein